MASSTRLRVACGTTLALEPVVDVGNVYETSYTRLVRLYEYADAPGAFPATRAKLYSGRLATLRLALREVDEDGFESAADLTGLTPVLRLHKKQKYYEVGDSVTTHDFDLTVESPATSGLCYVEFDGSTNSVPDADEYAAEVAFEDGSNYATFATFSLFVVRADI